jgi:4-carboxymuconolactone decarboxylase
VTSGATPDYDAIGRAIQQQLTGGRAGDEDLALFPPAQLAPEFFALVRQFCFGMFWSRPNLGLRDRSLITVAMLAAMGKQEELRGHIAGALRMGVTREEVIEVLMHAGVYAGVPAGVSALTTAAAVLGTE